MRKIILYRIITVIAIDIIILGILMASTQMPNKQKNGFTRNFIPEKLQELQSVSLDASFTSISGMTGSTIFLGSENPFAILMLNKDLIHKDTLMIRVSVPREKIVPFHVYVDSPWINIHFNNMKTIVHGKFPNQNLTMTELKTPIFTKSIQISPSTCVIKTMNFQMKKQVFQKVNIETGEIMKEADVPELDNSNWMSSDGILGYEPSLAKLIYVEYLRNRFYYIDSNLNVIHKGKTIDTVSINQTKLKKETEASGKTKLVPSGARIVVNSNCFWDNNNLYITSGLRADNESIQIFNKNTTVDVYDITTGSYISSFHVPNQANDRLRSAFVKNDTLTALFKKGITTFKISNKL